MPESQRKMNDESSSCELCIMLLEEWLPLPFRKLFFTMELDTFGLTSAEFAL